MLRILRSVKKSKEKRLLDPTRAIASIGGSHMSHTDILYPYITAVKMAFLLHPLIDVTRQEPAVRAPSTSQENAKTGNLLFGFYAVHRYYRSVQQQVPDNGIS
jgi:hypothetical protein